MPVDRALVEQFLDSFDRSVVTYLQGEAARLTGFDRLLNRHRQACDAWQRGAMPHLNGIMETANELCIAELMLSDDTVASIEYEPRLPEINQTIDFLVHGTRHSTPLYYDVKTVDPDDTDAWERFQRAQRNGWLSPNTDIVLDERWLGGEIAHHMFATRERFLEHTLALEQKIRGLSDRSDKVFHMIFCSDGFKWRRDHLEDFSDFYRVERHRRDDALATMEAHYMQQRCLTLDKTIDGFCYFERPKRRTEPTAFARDVRGPSLPGSTFFPDF